jgi:hypothetical protein
VDRYYTSGERETGDHLRERQVAAGCWEERQVAVLTGSQLIESSRRVM